MTSILHRIKWWTTGAPPEWPDHQAFDERGCWVWFDGRLEYRLSASPPIQGGAELACGQAQPEDDIDRIREATRRIAEEIPKRAALTNQQTDSDAAGVRTMLELAARLSHEETCRNAPEGIAEVNATPE